MQDCSGQGIMSLTYQTDKPTKLSNTEASFIKLPTQHPLSRTRGTLVYEWPSTQQANVLISLRDRHLGLGGTTTSQTRWLAVMAGKTDQKYQFCVLPSFPPPKIKTSDGKKQGCSDLKGLRFCCHWLLKESFLSSSGTTGPSGGGNHRRWSTALLASHSGKGRAGREGGSLLASKAETSAGVMNSFLAEFSSRAPCGW